MKTNYTDQKNTLWPKTGGGRLFKTTHSGDTTECHGIVATPYGFVDARSYNYPKWKISSLMVIKDGQEHTRRFNKAYTQRGLVTKAKQFAKDIFNNEV